MVALESSARDSGAIGELVELVVRDVADQVAPLLASPPPTCIVDQDRHGVTLPHTRRCHTDVVAAPEPELELAWQRHVGGDRRLLDALLSRHREKQRRYHTATHVAWVIRHIEELAGVEHVDHLDEVIAAAFYHDAVYEPTHPANERASARLARRDLATLGWSDERAGRVAAMIEATAHGARDTSAGDTRIGDTRIGDTAILLDADLAILGSDPAAYSDYVSGVRAEFRHVDDDEWRIGRAAVLSGFLDRPAIYSTPTGRSRWEQRARANLAAELAGLR